MQKLLLSKVVVLMACTVVPQCALAQTQTNFMAQSSAQSQRVLPGYVDNRGVTEIPVGSSPTAASITAPGSAATAGAAAAAVSVPSLFEHRGYVAGNFLATTTSVIEGYSILDYKGLVEGASVRVPTWSEDAAAGTREVTGGSIDSYAQLCEEARIQAFTTMVERAKKLGANAVIGIHFDSQVMPLDKGKFATGVVCVGTAVTARRK